MMIRSVHSRYPERRRPGADGACAVDGPRAWPWRAVSRTAIALLVAALPSLMAPVSRGSDPLEDEAEEPDTTDISASVVLPATGEHEVLPAVTEPFGAGEKLRFSVQYGFVHAGTAYLEVPEVKNWNGHEVYTFRATAKSNAFFSVIYKVRNRIESYWDKGGQFSRRYHENRREGGYKKNEEILFEHDLREARYSDGQVYAIPPHVQDALSSFYYARYQALPLGGSIFFDYHASRKSKPLEIKVLGRETVKTPAGKFDCVVIEPMLKAGGIFKKSGRLVIWLTNDERRLPVLMKSKVTIGSISVVLQEAKLGA